MSKVYEQMTPATWIKGEFHDTVIGPDGIGVNAHCALGWIEVAMGESMHRDIEKYDALKSKLRQAAGLDDISGEIAAWNDAPERKFEEVQAAFQKADI